jgi:hypothetical protein
MPVFEVISSSDPLGLWTSTPQPISFDINHENTPETSVPIYRVTFSDRIEDSKMAMEENLANFEQLNAALDQVPIQLDDLVQRQQKRASSVSFSAAAADLEMGAESELLSLLASADAAALMGTAPQSVAFGLNEVATEVIQQAKEKFNALLEQINHEILHFAWVEMKIGGLLIARTEVSWNGDSTTIWNQATSSDQMSLHRQTLQVVSQTRNLKLRLLFTVTSGAAKMAALMAAPGGIILALPGVYQYVIRILAQVKQIQSIQSS